MRIAVVGTGIAGLMAARSLHAEHELDVYEAAA
jgi:predicted NAD/FAD-binding protein